MDAVYVPLLIRRIHEEYFRTLKWPLIVAAALVWFGIWSWAIGNFGDTVYAYVFPAWSLRWIPWMAAVGAGAAAWGLHALSLRLRPGPILTYCLAGGLMGSLTHIWAVYRGIVSKPPMLQGVSPYGAIIIAFFEYMFYWCSILVIAAAAERARHYVSKLHYRTGNLRRI
jgi:hypothetical protein